MQTTTTNSYDAATSDARLKEILDSSETFEEVNAIPSRDKLTYSNGFYVNCTAVFIDIRNSSKLPEKHTRPVLGKIYRAYLSECVAIMNSDPNCREIMINGDCVSGIMNTPYQSDINTAFSTTAKLNSLINILNWRLEQKSYTPIRCGIGIAYGRALMMKAGYKGSGLNDVIWMGDVVNESSNLCHQGNRGVRLAVQVSTTVFNNLTNENKKLLTPVYGGLGIAPLQYEGDIVNIAMNDWLKEKKQQALSTKTLAAVLAGQRLGATPQKTQHWI
jgi:class 3 adenylate cyclase